jgi:DNA-binding CsgD family transcriptional regulator
LTLEAKWLMPAGAIPEVVAKDPKSCLLAVTIELREQAVARAARILRECGATPAQLKVGIQLVLGKTRPAIADELGLKHSTVADLAKKLYQILDVRNATELGARIWLGEGRKEVHDGHVTVEVPGKTTGIVTRNSRGGQVVADAEHAIEVVAFSNDPGLGIAMAVHTLPRIAEPSYAAARRAVTNDSMV